MKNFLTIILMGFLAQLGQAQEQAAIYDHYLVAPILNTPAVAGFDGQHHILANFNTNWIGFDGANKTYSIQYHGAVGKILGLGLGVMSEEISNMTTTRFQLNYAAHFNLNKNIRVAAGLSTDFYRTTLSNSVNDPIFGSGQTGLLNEGDQLIMDAVDGESVFDAGVGFWAEFHQKTFVGLTIPNLVVTKIGDIESGESEGSAFSAVIFQVGHEFEASPLIKIEPSLMIRSLLDSPTQIHFNVLGSFLDEQLKAGLSYRAGEGGSMGVLLGTSIDVFELYYSFGYGFSNFQEYSQGKHEITVGFTFGDGKSRYDRD